MRNNGSRGVTIERGSTRCTLANCLVAGSGREGLWAPNCTGLVISGNVFDRNGRKAGLATAGGDKEAHTANLCIDCRGPRPDKIADRRLFDHRQRDLHRRISERRFASMPSAAKQIVIKNNLLRGENLTSSSKASPTARSSSKATHPDGRQNRCHRRDRSHRLTPTDCRPENMNFGQLAETVGLAP